MLYRNLTELVGGTPLMELCQYGKAQGAKARILAKLELSDEEKEQAKADMEAGLLLRP